MPARVSAVGMRETAALRLHATELLLLIGTAIVLLVERPLQPELAGNVTDALSLQQAELRYNR